MALRLLEAHVPPELAGEAENALQEAAAQAVWSEPGGPYGTAVSAVVGAGRTGDAMDRLHECLSSHGRFRVLVTPLQAVLPRPPASQAEERDAARSAAAVSREEVYASVSEGAQLSSTYMALTVLASVVAAIGLTDRNVPAVIGAMVVAPLLGPNIGLALGLTLGDGRLVREAIRTAVVGFGLAYATALLLGLGLDPDPALPAILESTRPGLVDLLLALAAGCAGTLAYATGAASYLVGVMVAVALLPPTVASGLLLGQGQLAGALDALLMALANTAGILLAAMGTFMGKGLRPRNWWEEGRARRSSRVGLAVSALLFVLMGVAVLLARTLR